MLNRRILRTKAFKAVYCYAENRGMSLKDTEGFLDLSCEATRDLYLFLLSIVGPLTREAAARIQAAQSKFNPSEEELRPNLKFVENKMTAFLCEDIDFSKLIGKKKLSWDAYDMFLRHLYEQLKTKKYFIDYLQSEESSLKEDAKLWARIFEREFEDNSELIDILEELSIYWNDDLGYALRWCCKTMLSMGDGTRWQLIPLYQSDLPQNAGYTSDKSFVFSVMRSAYLNFDTFCDKITALTPQWRRERLCTTDLVLIICGMAEAKAYPATPVKVIINEYVELSKSYSTPDSSGFVNGLLDKLINNTDNND